MHQSAEEEHVAPDIRDLSGKRKRSYEQTPIQNFDSAKQCRPIFWDSNVPVPENPEKLNTFQKIMFAWLVSHTVKLGIHLCGLGLMQKYLKTL